MNSSLSTAWPPDYLAELTRRVRLYEKLRDDDFFYACAIEAYKTDPVRWINDCCITYDPRHPTNKVMPFILFQRQVEFIHFLMGCYNDKEGGLVEKARDIGASWLCCAFSVWLWLFFPGVAIGWGSRKEEYVDKKGDPKAIFPKIRQIIDRLPPVMKPAGFRTDIHATYMKITNPENGSVITGEAGDNQGRGGRTSIYFKDESAHYERPDLIEAALGDNTDVQIDVSSVNGSANVFYRRRMAGQVWEPDAAMERGRTRVFIFDWRDHPQKTQEWYDRRRAKAESEGLLHVFAQEVDRDYSGSVDRVVIRSEWVRAAIDAHILLNFTDEGDAVAGQDVADGGGDKNALAIRKGVVLRYIDQWGSEAGEAAKRAIPDCIRYSARELYYDSIGVGAGFKAEINHMRENGALPHSINVMPWNAGAKPLDPDDNIIYGDRQSPTNADQYMNLKAQAWFRLRARFYKTFRAIMHGDQYDPSELISLDSTMPKVHELIMQLSQATYDSNGAGKTVIEKKPDGATSPNLADAVVICYNPTRSLSIFDVL